ncbi:MAG: type VI secretion system contractile sheath domain-containing protein [Planctomycetota bacterium]|jgi:type VI secretion system protein ImpC
MSMQISSEKTDFQLGTLTSFTPARVSDDTPFCIAVLGDFSGRGSRGQCEKGPALAARRRTAVDVDNLEGLPGKLGCEVHIPVGGKNGPRIAIRVSELDHFHPDQIYDRLEIFQELKATRERLRDPATFSDAASQVRSWLAGPENTEASKPVEAQSVPAQEEPDADTIERLLGRQPDRQHHSAPAGQSADIEGLIREIIQPYIVPAPHPQQAELISQVDQAISGQMRAILHHPDLQKIEAAWRTLHLLVSQVETDETLKIYAIDITKAELAADLASADQLQSAGTYRLLAEQSVGVQGTQPYALLVGGYRFDHTADDINLLCRLARATLCGLSVDFCHARPGRMAMAGGSGGSSVMAGV